MLIDISVPLRPEMPVWPGDAPFCHRFVTHLDSGGSSTLSRISMGSHAGTHLDAPMHMISGAAPLEAISLDVFVGPACVVEVPDVMLVTAAHLEARQVPEGTRRVLLKTRNSSFWSLPDTSFRQDFTALSSDGARWLVDRGVFLVGIDYLSIEQYENGSQVHEILLGNNVCILEGLDLSAARPGSYELMALPLSIPGIEGSPVRAILKK